MLTTVLADVADDLRGRGLPVPPALLPGSTALTLVSRWDGRVVYAVFAPGARRPSLVLKVDRRADYQQRLHREHDALAALEGRPAVLGRVPRPVALVRRPTWHVLAQTALPGVPLKIAMRRRLLTTGRQVARDHLGVLRWLALLHAQPAPGTAPLHLDGDAAVEALRRALLPLGATGRDLGDRAGGGLRELDGLALPVLPGHGDLGPSNCLVDAAGEVSVIDFEGAVGDRVPLTDLLIFLSHYARASPVSGHRPVPRQESFRRAFCDDGVLGRATAASWRSGLRHLGLPVEAAGALFLTTLVGLVDGTAPAVHAGREGTRAYWLRMLAVHAEHGERSLLGP